MTARLGVRWTKAITGIADIEGVSLDVLGISSTRRARTSFRHDKGVRHELHAVPGPRTHVGQERRHTIVHLW